mgnify:CR=1 FL=1
MVAPVRKNSSEDLGRVLREHDNVVLMKPSTDPQALLKALKENHLEDRFVLITKTGTGEERLVTDLRSWSGMIYRIFPRSSLRSRGGSNDSM